MIFWKFRTNAFFLNAWLGEYICSVPSKQGVKIDASLAKKMVSLNLNQAIWKLNWQVEGQLYANRLFYILFICHKCLLFQFLSRDIRMHIPILTGVQNERIRSCKNGHIWLNIVTIATFESLNDKVKVNCMPMALLIFWQFKTIVTIVTILLVTNLTMLINNLVSPHMLYLKLYFNAT